MNKKAKGFTLIELLTVIAILAVIMLIATPIILGVLDKARRNTYKNQLLLYVEALKQQSALVLMGPGYSKLQEVDSNFYTPTNSTAGSIARVSVESLNQVMDNPTLTSDSTKYFYVEYTINGYNYYIGEGISNNSYTTTCANASGDNACTIRSYNDANVNLIKSNKLEVVHIGKTGASMQSGGDSSSANSGGTPEADTTKPTVSVSVSGTTVTLTLSDNVATDAYCVSQSSNSDSCSWVETSDTSIELTNVADGVYYAFARDTSENVADAEQYSVLNVSGSIGDAVVLGGYYWHIVGNDTTNNRLYLLLDEFNNGSKLDLSNRQIAYMLHCDGYDDVDNRCTWNGSKYVYTWEKSAIREYLNTTFYNTLSAEIKDRLVQQSVCKDKSINSASTYSYGGYTDSEIALVTGASCTDGYTTDNIRLMTPSEFYNLTPYSSYQSTSYPVSSIGANGQGVIPYLSYVTRLSAANDWLYSNQLGSFWLTGVVSGNNNIFVNYNMIAYINGSLDYVAAGGTGSNAVRPVIVLQK